MARKSFETNKKLQLANAVVSTASGVAAALVGPPGAPWSFPIAALVAGLGAAQIGIISGTSYDGGGSSGGATVPSSVNVGSKSNKVDLATSQSAAGELAYFRGERGTGNTGANSYVPTPAFAGVKSRAPGGSVGIMTGEQGPELFIPDRPGTVVPADETESISSGGTGNVTFQINAIDSQGVEDVLMAQRGYIIGMIREAANSKGQDFLESVNIEEDEAMR